MACSVVLQLFCCPSGDDTCVEGADTAAFLYAEVGEIAAFHGAAAGHGVVKGRGGGEDPLQQTDVMDFCRMSVKDALEFVDNLHLQGNMASIAEQILREIRSRLQFLADVGLQYLTLSRSSGTLSGGESQRIRLATQIGSSLMGVLYILDEPSIGLHQRDNAKLLRTLRQLRDLGNTLIVVEHDV